MPLHGFGVTAGQNKPRTNATFGTDATEYPGRLRSLILGCRGTASPGSPTPCQLGFLADPGLVLPPYFQLDIGGKFAADNL